MNPTIVSQFGNPSIVGQVCDVTDSTQLQEAVEATVRAFGGLDIVICNAGMFLKARRLPQWMAAVAWS
ncbi:MAG: SDR family oxidoreductase [Caldilineaceae bacterium]